MIDFEGNKLEVGDKFLYQFGTVNQCVGEIFDCDGLQIIKWDDDEIVSVKDFYYGPSDSRLLKKI